MEGDHQSDKDHNGHGQTDAYLVENDHDIEELESDEDYRARIMHIETLLRLNESLGDLKELSKKDPTLSTEVMGVLKLASSTVCDSSANKTSPKSTGSESGGVISKNDDTESITIKTHAHLIYYGDLLQLSKETVNLTISNHNMLLFQRIIHNSERMIMGRQTEDDMDNMRRDFDLLINMWNDHSANEMASLSMGGHFDEMMRSVMNTPVYYVNSCTALISCGQMLRNLYAESEVKPLETYQELMAFVRQHIRHNSEDPFVCQCANSGDNCSEEFKTLLSMIFEIPVIVQNQTYLLQVLSYLMYCDQPCREEVFINSLKSTCSPGLLDKIPARLAILMGTLDGKEIRKRFKDFRKLVQHLNPLKNDHYSRSSLDKLVQLIHDPRLRPIIEKLPCASAAKVKIRWPKCYGNTEKCPNKDNDGEKIMTKDFTNGYQNKCGYIFESTSHLLGSSLSLAQLLVYSLIDTRTGPNHSRKHFYIREIITSIARTMKIKTETLEDTFCYLDRMRVFSDLNHHPYLSKSLLELVTSYMDYMTDTAEKYKKNIRRRRMTRYLKKVGVDELVE